MLFFVHMNDKNIFCLKYNIYLLSIVFQNVSSNMKYNWNNVVNRKGHHNKYYIEYKLCNHIEPCLLVTYLLIMYTYALYRKSIGRCGRLLDHTIIDV